MTKTVEKPKSKNQPLYVRYKSGLTRRSITAMIYAMLVFTPAQIFMQLMTGTGVGAIAWFTLILWVEFTRMGGGRLSKQEAFFILSFAYVAGFPLNLIYWAWFRQSDIALSMGIAKLVPDWVAPPPSVGVLDLRSFFHPAWVLPIGVNLLGSLLAFCVSLGLGLFAREMYIEVERLPFPMQQMSAQGIEVLTEGTKRQRQVFSCSALIGLVYSTLVYAAPMVMEAWTGRAFQFIPIPFVDLNSVIEQVMPGAIFGIATTLSSFMVFWWVPFRITLATFLAAIGIGVFGNWFSVIYQLSPDADPILPGYQSWWTPGMGIPMALQRSTLFFWSSIMIGAGFAIGLAPVVGHPRRFWKDLKDVVKPRRKTVLRGERMLEPVSFTKIILPLILIGEVGGVMLFWWLAPDFLVSFPWIILLLILVPFLGTLVVNRLVGMVGSGENPFQEFGNIAYMAAQLQYPGIEQWFVPHSMYDEGKADRYKLCQILETRDIDYIKMQIILWPVSIAVGYLYMQFFWRIAPIPEGWPYVSIFWPVKATQFGVMIKGLEFGLLNIDWMIMVAIALLVFYLILDYAHSPLPYVAIAAGLVPGKVPFLVTGLIGAIVAHVIRKRAGDEWWYENRMIIGAGVATGTALAVAAAVAFSMIINSIWNAPI